MLSKVDIFDIRNNFLCKESRAFPVVNCSQKLISLIFEQRHKTFRSERQLWIALKSWYLWYSNNTTKMLLNRTVVNCSQKLISLIFGTTPPKYSRQTHKLWIALKSWYLWYSNNSIGTTKPASLVVNCSQKVDIFDIRNNQYLHISIVRILVVNCSQKLISLIFGTTQS